MILRVIFPRPKRHQFAQKALERLLDHVAEPAAPSEPRLESKPLDPPAPPADPDLAEAIRARLG